VIPSDLPGLVADAVLRSPKYRRVWPDFVHRLAAAELEHRRSQKEAVKAVKNKLHQVGAAYAGSPPEYSTWLAELQGIDRAAHPDAFRQACMSMMSAHASTRERLPILEEIYAVTLKDMAPIHSVLDAACGLHPLAIPWMPLASGAQYYACDIFLDLLDFLGEFLQLAGLTGWAGPCDLTTAVPGMSVDVVFLMKALPCLEQVDRHAVSLLERFNTRHILVSFPVQSLGGRSRGMQEYYPAHFARLLGSQRSGASWDSARFDFDTEIVFRLDRSPGADP